MKEKINITRFDGVFGVGDSRDLPSGAAFYAENLDFVTSDGSLTGLPQDDLYTANGAYALGDEIVLFGDGLKAAIYDPASGKMRVLSFNHTAKTTSLLIEESLSTSLTTSMVSSGEAIRVGLGGNSDTPPKRIGLHNHPQFGVSATSTYSVDNSELQSSAVGWSLNTKNAGHDSVHFVLPDSKANGSFASARHDNTQARFEVNKDYTWYGSLVYDGNQEAPLQKIIKIDLRTSGAFMYDGNPSGSSGTSLTSKHSLEMYDASGVGYTDGSSSGPHAYWKNAFGSNSTTTVPEVATGIKEISFWIRIRTADNASGNGNPVVSRRVSGIKLYRSESIATERGQIVESEPAYIKYYDLNDGSDYSWSAVNQGISSTQYFDEKGMYQRLYITDDGLPGTYTFESSTDYAATLEHMEVNYGLSCLSGGYHVVGQAWHRDLEEINTWVFRSKPYRFDTFDWANDYLVLPSKPTALVAYRGRVFAFTKGRVFVINPDIFDIEETWEGAGVEHEKSVVVTESGMFWASKTGIYHFDSARVHNISTPVMRLTRPGKGGTYSGGEQRDLGWLDRNSVVPVVAYSPVYDSLVVFYGAGDEFPGLLYHVPTKRWVPLSDMRLEVVNAHVNDDGDIMVGFGTSGGFSRLFTSINKRSWRYISRNLAEQGCVHKYYHAYIGSTLADDPPTLYFYQNDPLYRDRRVCERGTEDRQHANLYKYRLTETSTDDWAQVRDFAIEVTDTAGNIDASEITIIRRRITPR